MTKVINLLLLLIVCLTLNVLCLEKASKLQSRSLIQYTLRAEASAYHSLPASSGRSGCFIDTVDKLLATYQKRITTYETICQSLSTHKDIQGYLNKAVTLAYIQANFFLDHNYAMSSEEKNLISSLGFNSITYKDDVLSALIAQFKADSKLAEKNPVFLLEKVTILMTLKYAETYLRSSYKVTTECITVEKKVLDLVELLFTDINEEYSEITQKAFNEGRFMINPNGFNYGGYAFAFWIKEDSADINEAVRLFNGYVNDVPAISLTMKFGVQYEFSGVSGKDTIQTNGKCTQYTWVFVSIDKNCDDYHVTLVLRQSHTNARFVTESDVPKEYIEGLEIQLVNSYLHEMGYSHIKYSLDEEVRVFGNSLSVLKSSIDEIKQTCDKNTGDLCIYYSANYKECQACKKGAFMHEKNCVQKCPDFTFPSNKFICEKCTDNCVECLNQIQCNKCDGKTYLLNGQCVTQCPSNMFPTLDRECKKCDETNSCSICASLDKCSQCTPPEMLAHGKCVEFCPPKTYYSVLDNKCHDCPTTCAECKSATECTKCIPKHFLTEDKKCNEHCDAGYFPNPDSGECQTCISNCKTCENPTECKECKDNYKLLEDKTCGIICQSGQIPIKNVCFDCKDSNCHECSNTNVNICVVCKEGYVNKNGQCVLECGDEYYADKNDVCQSCKSKCKICQDASTCDQCISPFILVEKKECLTTCPDGYVQKGKECMKCTDFICKHCDKEGNQCTACYPPRVLQEGECETKCSSNYVFYLEECQKCPSGCAQCSDPFTCIKCEEGLVIDNMLCHTKCPEGKRKNQFGMCESCSVTDCKKCDGEKTVCDECIGKKLLWNNNCYESCPEETYMKEGSVRCEACSSNCAQCVDKEICINCQLGWFLEENVCKQRCSDGYYKFGQKCLKCEDPQCKYCDKTKDKCSACYADKVLQNGECVETCEDGKFPKDGSCHDCLNPCKTCTSQRDCTSCIETFIMEDGKTACTNECSDGKIIVDGVCKDCTDPKCKVCKSSLDYCEVPKGPDDKIDDGKVVPICPDGKYADDFICKSCKQHCAKCEKSRTCLQCSPGFLLKGDECVSDCGDNYVAVDHVCKKCDSNCKHCLASDTTFCTECFFKLLLEGQCLEQCPGGYWSNGERCLACSDSLCHTCSNEGKTCVLCKKDNAFFKDKCMPEPCEPGYIASDRKCVPCGVDHCEDCSVHVSYCNACVDQYFLVNPYQCNDKCPAGTYEASMKENSKKYSCENCQINCEKCDENQCLKCMDGKVLQDGQCICECNPGYFNNNGICEKCAFNNCVYCTKDKCLKCDSNFFYNSILNICVEKCPAGTYPNIDKTCIVCPADCKECTNDRTCTSCKRNLKLENEKCKDECSEGQVANDNKECVICQTANGCIKCDKEDLTICTECRSPLRLEENICVENCSESYYPQGKKCEKCIGNCKICFDGNVCVECDPGKVLFEDKCITTCPPGTYNIAGKCEPCKTGCVTCTKDDCRVCGKDLFLENGRCVDVCSPGYYNRKEKECDKCSGDCLACLGPKDCTSCSPGKAIGLDGFCYDTCKDKEIAIKGKCYSCSDKNCNKCSGSTDNCIECNEFTYLHNGKCLENCLPETFKDNGKCKPCIKNCAICKDKDTCEKCSDPFDYDVIETKCSDGLCPGEDSIVYKCDVCRPGYSSFKGICVQCKPGNCKECANSSDKCSKCDDGFVMYNAQCYDKCPNETYMPINSIECKDCVAPCKTCLNGDTCLTCEGGFHLDNKRCVSECSRGSITIKGVCTECKTKDCQICKENIEECIKCTEGLLLQIINGITTCVTDCGEGYYEKNGNCIKCSEDNCLTCKNDVCTKCTPETTLQGSKCPENCEPGYTERNNVCQACYDPNCAACDPLEIDKCYKCFLNFALHGKKCRETCGSSYYTKDYITHLECGYCGANCRICIDNKTCTECNNYTIRPNFYVIKEGVCVTDCGLNYVMKNGHCLKCTQPECNRCNSNDLGFCYNCKNRKFIDMNGKCIDKCPIGTFELNMRCYDCPSNCNVCNTNGICYECSNGMFLQDYKCVTECKSNYSPNDAKKCVKCKLGFCETCDMTTHACTSCPKGSFLHEGGCTSNCPKGTFADNGKCNSCISNCKVCYDNKECKECTSPFKVQEGICSDKCDKFHVDIKGVCELCNDSTNCIQCATDKSTCYSCETGTYLFQGKCVAQCPEKTYPSNGQCLSCGPNCVHCLSSTICNKCDTNFWLYKNECLTDCPSNTGKVEDRCKPCNDSLCEKCKSDFTTCEKCSGNYIVDDGKCIVSCLPGFYHDAIIQKCVSCVDGCAVCDNNVSCKQCKNNLIRTNQGLCDIECKDGQYKKPNELVCNDCINKTCKKCDPLNPDSCIQCPFGEFMITNKDGNVDCIKTCPEGTFVNEAKCLKCQPPCATCTNATHCLSCTPPMIHNENDDGCTSQCKDGYVDRDGHCVSCTDKKCKVCDPMSTNTCTVCMEGYILFRDECLETCPKGYYLNPINNLCEKCSSTCKECENPNECTVCAYNHHFLANSKECIQCSVPHILINDICHMCKVSECNQCTKDNAHTCDDCRSPYVLHEGKCLDTCPDGYTNLNGKCVKCEDNCALCLSITDCIKCDIGYVLSFGDCVGDCPSGWRNNKGQCEKCDVKDCSKCPDSKEICERCEDKVLYDNVCRDDCPQGTMIYNNQCVKCEDNCDVCDKKGCLVCKEGMFIQDGKCVGHCGDGFYVYDSSCLPCKDKLCLKCNSNKCEQCSDGSFLQPEEYKECGKTCPKGYLINPETGKCEKCALGCASCTIDTCEECTSPYAMLNGTCVTDCPPKFIPVKGLCFPCTQDVCAECTHEHPEICKVCEKGFLHKGECLEQCPNGTFGKEGHCPDCEPNCKKCQDENICKECEAGLILDNGDCVNNCGEGYVEYLNTCIPCAEETCLQCSEDTKTCFKCQAPTFLSEGKCIEICPRGTYPDHITNRCLSCHSSCDVCLSSESCEKCAPGYYMNLMGQCVVHCEEGTYEDCGEDVRKCKLCDPACKTCVSSTNADCLACKEGYFLFNRKCINNKSCPEGTYFDKDTCSNCEVNHCKLCNDPNTCTVCNREFTLTEQNGCVLGNKITPVINDYIQVTPLTYYDDEKRLNEIFPISAFKGTGVGSSTFSFSFYFRTLSPKIDTDTTVLTLFNEHQDVYNYRFIINTVGKCLIKVFEKDTPISTTQAGDCSYNDIYDWKYFSITITKGTSTFNVHASQILNGKVVTTDNMFAMNGRSGIVIVTSKIILNEGIQAAFNIGKLNIMDYSPSEEQIVSLSKYTPTNCDYFCTDCQSTCIACPKGDVLEGRCPAQYVGIFSQPFLIPEGQASPVAYSSLEHDLTNDRYGVTAWFLLTKIDDEKHYITKVKLEKSQIEASYLDIFVYNKKLHIGHLESQAIEKLLEANKWYFIVVTYTQREIKVTIRDQANYKYSQIIKDSFSRNYNSMTHHVGQNFYGSIFQFRSYINNIPSDADIKNDYDAFKCPEECETCTVLDLKCTKCKGHLILKDGVCSENVAQESKVTPLVNMIDIWSYEQVNYTIPEAAPFTININMRKKIDSYGEKKEVTANLISLTVNENIIPLITHIIYEPGDRMSFTDFKESYFFKQYDQVSFDFFNVIIMYKADTKELTMRFLDHSTGSQYSSTMKLKSDPTKLILGDNQAREIHMEYSNINLYSGVADKTLIDKLQNYYFDNQGTCTKYNFATKKCKECFNKPLETEGECDSAQFSISNSYLYGETKYETITVDRNSFKYIINSALPVNLNSIAYAVFFSFKLLKPNTGKNRIGCFKNDYLRWQRTIIDDNNMCINALTDSKGQITLVVDYYAKKYSLRQSFTINKPVFKAGDIIRGVMAIDVLKSTLTYGFVVNQNVTKYIKRQNLYSKPARLQNSGGISIFGLQDNLSTLVYAIPSAYVYDFVILTSFTYSDSAFENALEKIIPIRDDPYCGTKCTICVNANGQPKCLEGIGE